MKVTIFIRGEEHDTVPYATEPTEAQLRAEWTGLTGYKLNGGQTIVIHSAERLALAQAALKAGLTYWDALRDLEVEIAADREPFAGSDGEVEHEDLSPLMSCLNAPEDVHTGHARLLLDELLGIETPDALMAAMMRGPA